MMTFYGGVKFAPEGNNTAKPMVLRQIQGGEYVVVAPSKYASAKVIWPRASKMAGGGAGEGKKN